VFNPSNDSHLAVAGLKDCHVITLSSKGEVLDQLAIDLSLDALGNSIFILKVEWLPGSQVKLAVITNCFVKVYDLSKDVVCPIHNFTLIEDTVRDATFCLNDKGAVVLLLVSLEGLLYSHVLSDTTLDSEACILTELVQVPDNIRGKHGGSVHYSSVLNVILVSYEDGKCFAARLDNSCSSLSGYFVMSPPDVVSKPKTSPFNRWYEGLPGYFLCTSKKYNLPTGLNISNNEISYQNQILKGSQLSSRIEGICAFGVIHNANISLSGSSTNDIANNNGYCFLMEDDSFHRIDIKSSEEKSLRSTLSSSSSSTSLPTTLLTPPSCSMETKITTCLAEKYGTELLSHLNTSRRKRHSTTPSFPLDFFEHVECITPSVSLGGDVLLCYSSETAKQRLAANGDYIVALQNELFNILVQNPNADMVIVGLRVLVGAASLKHIPTSFQIFNRTIVTKDGRNPEVV